MLSRTIKRQAMKRNVRFSMNFLHTSSHKRQTKGGMVHPMDRIVSPTLEHESRVYEAEYMKNVMFKTYSDMLESQLNV